MLTREQELAEHFELMYPAQTIQKLKQQLKLRDEEINRLKVSAVASPSTATTVSTNPLLTREQELDELTEQLYPMQIKKMTLELALRDDTIEKMRLDVEDKKELICSVIELFKEEFSIKD